MPAQKRRKKEKKKKKKKKKTETVKGFKFCTFIARFHGSKRVKEY